MSDAVKLYVVNESTPDPKTWSVWSEWSLVLARNDDEARKMADAGSFAPVCVVPLDRPLHLVSMSEPAWGEDI